MTTLIPRNTTIPAKKTEMFSTAADNQTTVDVHVLQGERPLAKDNRTLGRFQLVGIPPAPRGTPQIEVTFDIDANGILHSSAKDMATGKEQRITITASSGLSDDEVKRMVKEAEANAADDARRREEIEVRNRTDALVYQIERSLRELGAQLPADQRREVDQALSDAREALNGNDVNRIRAASNNLERAASTLADASARAASASESGPAGQPAEGEVVDAQFAAADDGHPRR